MICRLIKDAYFPQKVDRPLYRENNYITQINPLQSLSPVLSESIQTPWLFPHFIALQPYSKMDSRKKILIKIHTIPNNDNAKTYVNTVKYLQHMQIPWRYLQKQCKYLQQFRPFNLRLKIELWYILFPLIVLDWSPVEVKINCLDIIWKAHTCLYKVLEFVGLEVVEIVCKAPRQDCVE